MGGSGGGGGGGAFTSRTPDQLRAMVRKSEAQTQGATFEAELSRTLGDLLASYNGRDVGAANQRLTEIKGVLTDEIDGTFDQLFGGSVAKHTYVDGLSDIDSLVLLNDSELQGQSPEVVLHRLTETLRQRLGDAAQVEHGRMAVTVTYPDGMAIQLLPAVETTDGKIQVPSSRTEDWSKINPATFREALTQRNQQCAGKLVPTIKLAKAVIGQLPDSQRLAGYHVESLGIAAFRDYKGDMKTSAMVPEFFERASKLVLSPIRDSTGQSVHVDEYLGPSGSEQRVALSHVLSRIGKRMRNASAAGSTSQWKALFGLDE